MALQVLTSDRAARMAEAWNTPDRALLREVRMRKSTKQAEMARFAELCDRFDNLYYPNTINKYGGADHWPDDESAIIEGRVHVSLNIYPAYVDIPASLQSVEPIENLLPLGNQPQARDVAAAVERAYFAWKDEEDFELKAHQACVVKGLYGHTAAKVYWDEDENRPCIQIVDQPRNLWLGWSSQNYRKLDWALYSYKISVNEAIERYGVDVSLTEMDEDGRKVRLPIFKPRSAGALNDGFDIRTRNWLNDDQYMVECVDYWYRKPKEGATITVGERTAMETWNAIIVGNVVVKDKPHSEYAGQLPYVVLFNSYIPGVPDGRSELYDIEQLVREKDERLSAGGQLIQKAVKGQMWQLTGMEAPDVVPNGVKPKADEVVAPGAGNRLEAIQPYIPTFDLMSYLDRLDRELVDVSGLNDLLRGIAPAQVLSSSKAINALVANYEARIRMKRDVFYIWRRNVWNLAKTLWGNKNGDIRQALTMVGRLDIKAPSITPRDDLETATLATNLLNARVWSLARAQDTTGVDDPEGETAIIREERTDATLFPADVQTQASLMMTLQQLQLNQQAAQVSAQQQAAQAANAQRQAIGGFMGSPMMNGASEQIATPPEAGPPGGAALPPGLPPSGPGENLVSQTAIRAGEPSNRILMQQPIAPEAQGGGGGGG